ncbi:MAG: carbohydrate kinase family protein [Candidatus Methanoliparum thermophilum]|uniref:Carbohydrate kinase family protein n=1 Tax=Methanoliparum thermophilum TaxID=2491083 RepID=A0A520KR87_METT2|nr:carbohydrate kinase family protein [Candidatus Methanoliparum sp. LAM-1]RZN64091.1 MAG: carbohydrate kinase family protein [Candidatus Methanoliparum thermophilum]BDC35648.1 sugar kinase [Candidatus Methanoliparum sp. LAM-1]
MDIIGFGALNLDKICFVDKIPREDEEGFVLRMEEYPGGSAANTIVGLTRLDIKTGYIGKIANDDAGRIIFKDLLNEKVDTTGIIKENKGRSGVAEVFVNKKGGRSIIVDSGVNDFIKISEIDIDYVEKFKIIHLTSFVSLLSRDSFETQKKILKLVNNPVVSFDPGFLYAEKGLNEMIDFLRYTDILFINEREIMVLTNEKNFKSACNVLSDYVETLIVKLGDKGCFVKRDDKEFFSKPFIVDVVDTTGAGDAFNAGFLYGILKKRSIEDCARIGNKVASLSITRSGARAGLPFIKDLENENYS